MSKNKLIRFIMFAVAIWLVLSMATLLTSFIFQGWQQSKKPSVSNIVEGLQARSEYDRKLAIEKIKHPDWYEEEIILALYEMALNEKVLQLKANAIGLLTTGYNKYTNMTREQLADIEPHPVLDAQKIKTIADLVLEETIDNNLVNGMNPVMRNLQVFLQNTINAQPDPQLYVNHYTGLLNKQLQKEIQRSHTGEFADLLQVLKTYASHVVFNDETMSVLEKVYKHETSQYSHPAALVIETLRNQSLKQVFSSSITQMIEDAVKNHKNRTLRKDGITALNQQSLLTGTLSPVLEKAVDDPDDSNRQLATHYITHFNEAQGKKTGNGQEVLITTALDKTQRPEIRATSLQRGAAIVNGRYEISPEVFQTAEILMKDSAPAVRAVSISFIRHMFNHELYRQRETEIRDWYEAALQDNSAIVRSAAIHTLEYYPGDDIQRSSYALTGLKDKNRDVVLAAMRIVSVKKLNSNEIEKQLKYLSLSNDTAIQSYATRYHKVLEVKNSNFVENLLRIFSDPEQRVGGLFFAVALFAIAVATGFSLYYAFTFVKYLLAKNIKVVVSFVVIMLWTAATYALVGAFVFGLFGMGHNSPAPIDEQTKITLMLTGLVIGYTVFGFIMSLFVRIPKQQVTG